MISAQHNFTVDRMLLIQTKHLFYQILFIIIYDSHNTCEQKQTFTKK